MKNNVSPILLAVPIIIIVALAFYFLYWRPLKNRDNWLMGTQPAPTTTTTTTTPAPTQ